MDQTQVSTSADSRAGSLEGQFGSGLESAELKGTAGLATHFHSEAPRQMAQQQYSEAPQAIISRQEQEYLQLQSTALSGQMDLDCAERSMHVEKKHGVDVAEMFTEVPGSPSQKSSSSDEELGELANAKMEAVAKRRKVMVASENEGKERRIILDDHESEESDEPRSGDESDGEHSPTGITAVERRFALHRRHDPTDVTMTAAAVGNARSRKRRKRSALGHRKVEYFLHDPSQDDEDLPTEYDLVPTARRKLGSKAMLKQIFGACGQCAPCTHPSWKRTCRNPPRREEVLPTVLTTGVPDVDWCEGLRLESFLLADRMSEFELSKGGEFAYKGEEEDVFGNVPEESISRPASLLEPPPDQGEENRVRCICGDSGKHAGETLIECQECRWMMHADCIGYIKDPNWFTCHACNIRKKSLKSYHRSNFDRMKKQKHDHLAKLSMQAQKHKALGSDAKPRRMPISSKLMSDVNEIDGLLLDKVRNQSAPDLLILSEDARLVANSMAAKNESLDEARQMVQMANKVEFTAYLLQGVKESLLSPKLRGPKIPARFRANMESMGSWGDMVNSDIPQQDQTFQPTLTWMDDSQGSDQHRKWTNHDNGGMAGEPSMSSTQRGARGPYQPRKNRDHSPRLEREAAYMTKQEQDILRAKEEKKRRASKLAEQQRSSDKKIACPICQLQVPVCEMGGHVEDEHGDGNGDKLSPEP